MDRNRPNEILNLLTKEKRMEVVRLAEILQVSGATIRRDLDALEERGIVRREHGYAVLAGRDDVGARMAFHCVEKQRIAARAAELIHDGDTLMIENGSCCAFLAEALAGEKKNLTIVTNSVFIAGLIGKQSTFQVVLLGGIYQPEAQVMVGPLTRMCAENFNVDYLFIGADSYSEKLGFTNLNQMRAEAVRDMASHAEQVVVLAESEKFSRRGIIPLQLEDRITTVITDEGIPSKAAEVLRRQNIKVITA